MKTRVLIADDHKLLREGLRHIVQDELRLEVVGLAEDGRSAVSLAAELHPDIIIMDISMPGLNGIEATRQIRRDNSGTKIVALSIHKSKDFVSKMLQAGAAAYMLKDCAVDELGEAIRCVLAGKVYISPDIAGLVVDDYLKALESRAESASPKLTPKETEVLQLIAEGKTTKEIASILSTGVSTIETHRQHIMEKLKIYTVAGLTVYAVREGLISID